MVEQIVLTKEEYNDLLKRTVVDERHTIVTKQDLAYLEACEYSLEAFTNTIGLCPNCRKAILVDGYICPSCNYDRSYSVTEWNEMHNRDKKSS